MNSRRRRDNQRAPNDNRSAKQPSGQRAEWREQRERETIRWHDSLNLAAVSDSALDARLAGELSGEAVDEREPRAAKIDVPRLTTLVHLILRL